MVRHTLQTNLEKQIINIWQSLIKANHQKVGNINLAKYTEESKRELILEVDLEYPQEQHDLYYDYPLAAEIIKLKKKCYHSVARG